MRHAGSRSGAVLVVVVLLALALLALAHGLLVSAELAYTTSAAHRDVVELDALAEGRVEEERRGGWQPWMDSLAVGASRTLPAVAVGGFSTRGRWRRLGTEAWLAGASASRDTRAPVTLRRLLWLMEPRARLAALPGVLSVGSGAPVTVQGVLVADSAPAVGVVADASLGLLDLRRLLELGDSLGPSGTPAPAELGGLCDVADVWNWGDPLRLYRPCGAHRPLKSRRGSLTVSGGEGQGVLTVDGDLVMTSGARFHGLVVTSGRLELRAASVLEGSVLALGGVFLDPTARVVGSPGRTLEALESLRGLAGAARPLHPAVRLGPG